MMEYYQAFAEKLAPFLHQVILKSTEKGTLPPSMIQGLITLIPKPKKDICHINNWRPISLLNNDHQISASIIANRIREVLDPDIDEVQSGFRRKRHISNNIGLVLDLIDNSFLCPDSFLFFPLDFYKAFDTIEH